MHGVGGGGATWLLLGCSAGERGGSSKTTGRRGSPDHLDVADSHDDAAVPLPPSPLPSPSLSRSLSPFLEPSAAHDDGPCGASALCEELAQPAEGCDSPDTPGAASEEQEQEGEKEEEVARLRKIIDKLNSERDDFRAQTQLSCEMAIIEAKQAHQRALMTLEADIETSLRAQIAAEMRDLPCPHHLPCCSLQTSHRNTSPDLLSLSPRVSFSNSSPGFATHNRAASPCPPPPSSMSLSALQAVFSGTSKSRRNTATFSSSNSNGIISGNNGSGFGLDAKDLEVVEILNSRVRDLTLKNEELSEKARIFESQLRQFADECHDIELLREQVTILTNTQEDLEACLYDLKKERENLNDQLVIERSAHRKSIYDADNETACKISSARAEFQAAAVNAHESFLDARAQLERANADLESSRALFAVRTEEYDAAQIRAAELERSRISLEAELAAAKATLASTTAEALGTRGALESQLELERIERTSAESALEDLRSELCETKLRSDAGRSRVEQLEHQLLYSLRELENKNTLIQDLEPRAQRSEVLEAALQLSVQTVEELQVCLLQLKQQRRSLQAEVRRLCQLAGVSNPVLALGSNPAFAHGSDSVIMSSSSALARRDSFASCPSGLTPAGSTYSITGSISKALGLSATQTSSGSNGDSEQSLQPLPPMAAPTSSLGHFLEVVRGLQRRGSASRQSAPLLLTSTSSTNANLPATTKSYGGDGGVASEAGGKDMNIDSDLQDANIKVDYIKQTLKQFLLRPEARKPLVSIVQRLLDCTEEESKILSTNFEKLGRKNWGS